MRTPWLCCSSPARRSIFCRGRDRTDRRDRSELPGRIRRSRLRLRRLDGAPPGGVLRPLHAAERLLDAGADPSAVSQNSLRNTPLHAALAGKHTDVALLLIARGADVNAIDAAPYAAPHRRRERVDRCYSLPDSFRRGCACRGCRGQDPAVPCGGTEPGRCRGSAQ